MLYLQVPVVMSRADARLGSSSSFIISCFEVRYFLICSDLFTISDYVDFESQIHFSKTSLKIM